MEQMQELALQANQVTARDEEDIAAKRSAAIAKCHRRIDAARHLYEDGDLSREEYLRRKERNEQEIAQWQTYTTEREKLLLELAMCVDAVNRIAQLWDASDDEDRQGMVRNLFEHIVFDLDRQQIVDFELKAWASRFLILREALYDDDDDGTSSTEGTNGAPSPVGVTFFNPPRPEVNIFLGFISGKWINLRNGICLVKGQTT